MSEPTPHKEGVRRYTAGNIRSYQSPVDMPAETPLVLASDYDKQEAELAVWKGRADGVADMMCDADKELQRLESALTEARGRVEALELHLTNAMELIRVLRTDLPFDGCDNADEQMDFMLNKWLAALSPKESTDL